LIISRYSIEEGKMESRDLPIESSQLYDFMSGTPASIAMPQLNEEDQRFVEGCPIEAENLDFTEFDELLDIKEQFG
jgi:hypothetical protein